MKQDVPFFFLPSFFSFFSEIFPFFFSDAHNNNKLPLSTFSPFSFFFSIFGTLFSFLSLPFDTSLLAATKNKNN